MDQIQIVIENNHILAVSGDQKEDVTGDCVMAALRIIADQYAKRKDDPAHACRFDPEGFMYFIDKDDTEFKCIVKFVNRSVN